MNEQKTPFLTVLRKIAADTGTAVNDIVRKIVEMFNKLANWQKILTACAGVVLIAVVVLAAVFACSGSGDDSAVGAQGNSDAAGNCTTEENDIDIYAAVLSDNDLIDPLQVDGNKLKRSIALVAYGEITPETETSDLLGYYIFCEPWTLEAGIELESEVFFSETDPDPKNIFIYSGAYMRSSAEAADELLRTYFNREPDHDTRAEDEYSCYYHEGYYYNEYGGYGDMFLPEIELKKIYRIDENKIYVVFGCYDVYDAEYVQTGYCILESKTIDGEEVWTYHAVSAEPILKVKNTGEAAAPVIEEGQNTAGNIRYLWMIEPTIKADDINVAVCSRPAGFIMDGDYCADLGTVGMHKYDRVSVIMRNGKLGLITYKGGIITGVEFDNIDIGYDEEYVLTKYGADYDNTCYTLSKLYELVKLENEMEYGILGTDTDGIAVWVESKGLMLMTGEVMEYELPDRTIAAYYASKNDIVTVDGSMWIDLQEDCGVVLIKDGKRLNNVIYEAAGNMSSGVIPVKLNGKWGYVDNNGKQILPCEFDACWKPLGTYVFSELTAYNASNGFIVVCKNNQYALYDTDGNLVVDFGEFEKIRPVYEGMCWVCKDGKWGVIAVGLEALKQAGAQDNDIAAGASAYVSSSSGLRMREGPGTDYCVVGMLSNGAAVTVYETSGDWSYVCFDSVYGWVKTKYLK